MGDNVTLDSEQWAVRIGQIQSVLTFFGGICSVSVEIPETELCPAHEVYVQAQREDGALAIELIGNQYLPDEAVLVASQQERLHELGWEAPRMFFPNWSRYEPEEDLGDLARTLAESLAVLGVTPELIWTVSPPELGNEDAGLVGLEIVDTDDRSHQEELLRSGSGAALAALVAGDTFSWDELIEAGLPRDDRQAELAMLYRKDCTVDFLRESRFTRDVMKDPNLPRELVDRLLKAKPTALEINDLTARGDLNLDELAGAAQVGLRLARWRGRGAESFLALRVMPVAKLRDIARQQEDEAVGMLRHPRCPDDIVLRFLHARQARVRLWALRSIQRRNLPIDSGLIRSAARLPVAEPANGTFPYAERIRTVAEKILENR